jgi:hypothetical protein
VPVESGEAIEDQSLALFREYAKRIAVLRSRESFPVLWTATDPAHGKWNIAPYDWRFRSPQFSSSGLGHHSVVVFPDAVLLSGISPSGVGSVVVSLGTDAPLKESLAVLASDVRVEPLPGLHVVACVHHTRSENCASCGTSMLRDCRHDVAQARGPRLADRYSSVAAGAGLRDSAVDSSAATDAVRDKDVALWTSSCLGEAGDAYGGNVVVYPSGDWLGQMEGDQDATRLLSFFGSHFPSLPSAQDTAQRFLHTWRGRVGLRPDQQLQVLRQALAELPALTRE